MKLEDAVDIIQKRVDKSHNIEVINAWYTIKGILGNNTWIENSNGERISFNGVPASKAAMILQVFEQFGGRK